MPTGSIEGLWRELWSKRFDAKMARLRFELGGEEFSNIDQQVPRFLQAHERARIIASYIFPETCIGLAAWHLQDKPSSIGLRRVKSGLKALELTGFNAERLHSWQGDLFPDPEEDVYSIWQINSYDLSGNSVARDTLLWHAVAFEMPIFPSASVTTFLIDPTRELMFHVYDDRGLDVWSSKPTNLVAAYQKFNNWLLDYDRDWMAQIFQSI